MQYQIKYKLRYSSNRWVIAHTLIEANSYDEAMQIATNQLNKKATEAKAILIISGIIQTAMPPIIQQASPDDERTNERTNALSIL